MFAHDGDDYGEDDHHLPLKERGCYRRVMEREAARERFERLYPDFMERMGRAVGEEMTRIALEVLTDGESNRR
jgi:hypothetical protein